MVPDEGPIITLPTDFLKGGILSLGVTDEGFSARCAGTLAGGKPTFAGCWGVALLCPNTLNVQSSQIKKPRVFILVGRIREGRKIKYAFFRFIKKIIFAKRPLSLWLTKVFTNSYLTTALERFWSLKIIKSIGRQISALSPGIVTTLVLLLLPLLALTSPDVFSPELTQDTVRRAGSQETASEADEAPNQLRTLVLDAGHGGKDPGTHGRYAKEKTINLALILALGRKIKNKHPDIRVIYTRSSDHFVDLYERGAIANRNRADLFISIHCNASPSSSQVNGTETYTLGLHKTQRNLDVARRENAVILQEKNYQQTYKGFDPNSPLATIMLANYQHAFMGSSINFAEKIERSFRRNAERKSNGVKQAGFIVLWKATMPSVLIETGYLTNPAEEDYLRSDEGQEEISAAIYKAFLLYKQEIEAEG